MLYSHTVDPCGTAFSGAQHPAAPMEILKWHWKVLKKSGTDPVTSLCLTASGAAMAVPVSKVLLR